MIRHLRAAALIGVKSCSRRRRQTAEVRPAGALHMSLETLRPSPSPIRHGLAWLAALAAAAAVLALLLPAQAE